MSIVTHVKPCVIPRGCSLSDPIRCTITNHQRNHGPSCRRTTLIDFPAVSPVPLQNPHRQPENHIPAEPLTPRPKTPYLHLETQLGADVTVNVKELSPSEAALRVVGDGDGSSGGGRRPDACVDCCGFESSVATALAAAKSGGKVCLVGMVRKKGAEIFRFFLIIVFSSSDGSVFYDHLVPGKFRRVQGTLRVNTACVVLLASLLGLSMLLSRSLLSTSFFAKGCGDDKGDSCCWVPLCSGLDFYATDTKTLAAKRLVSVATSATGPAGFTGVIALNWLVDPAPLATWC